MRKLSAAIAIILITATCVTLSAALILLPRSPSAEPDNGPLLPAGNLPEPDRSPLRFGEGGAFRILHLSDFHEWMGIERERA